ncbi:conserved hypothetical protein [Beutenbergia cavernae DSM 12333]|uniref:Nitroreductase n=1 Tax=Beutenbergia cavernae (strain ATCC BAA-8 / DSM 12333 / CCUG 43141 / JCM 11478 / NBRC 16432 / NCIMB 13614 / HKI 0122) TaxID=471853 RepID=C5C471_BEUC1|nr:nitroreductase/quinone reductase family protein [Beutenbergia cavernae]ACQ79984.1 conserved hypothetical protein [Beutenbergia cavernae DSM 12333]
MRTANRVSIQLYRRTGGKVASSAKGLPVLLITVRGRRTGRLHTVPVVYLEHDGGLLVFGSAGGASVEPAWFRNVRSSGRVQIEVGQERYDADADVADDDRRDRLWHDVVLPRAPFFASYQVRAAGRTIPVALLTPVRP